MGIIGLSRVLHAHDCKMLEMEAILIAFLENFEFSPAPGNPEIVRSPTVLMNPMFLFPYCDILASS
jgi:hypothetical protein